MRNTKAKAIRRVIYGDQSPRARTYTVTPNAQDKRSSPPGTLHADETRAAYQHAKAAAR